MKKLLFSVIIISCFFACTPKQPIQKPENTQSMEQLILSRRSIRKYKPQKISRDTLEKIAHCGINAPNGKNLQAYEIRIVDNPQLIEEISQSILESHPEMNQGKSLFFHAPCVIFIAASKNYDMSHVDCGLLGENIILSAWEMGIGSCCMAYPIRLFKESESSIPYLQRLNFSEGYDLLYCITLGYPDESPDAKPRDNGKFSFVD